MLKRILRHVLASRRSLRRAFPAGTLQAIERAVGAAERLHSGQIRFALEAELDWPALLAGMSARERALEVFSRLRVWDTERNNGVLIYVLFADRNVEVVADRGFAGRVSDAQWQEVCETMRRHFLAGDYRQGAVEGVEAIGRLMAACFPPDGRSSDDQMPDEPVVF